MICLGCGEPVPQNYLYCNDCIREIVETVEQKREQIFNNAARQVEHEADKVYAKDPTRGRGRGPKWMDG